MNKSSSNLIHKKKKIQFSNDWNLLVKEKKGFFLLYYTE